jgi:hypothetical protein
MEPFALYTAILVPGDNPATLKWDAWPQLPADSVWKQLP